MQQSRNAKWDFGVAAGQNLLLYLIQYIMVFIAVYWLRKKILTSTVNGTMLQCSKIMFNGTSRTGYSSQEQEAGT
jgi:hypothetical protein